MKIAVFKNNWLTSLAALLVIPGAYFVVVGVLSSLGVNGPLEAIQPFAEKLGIKDPPGFNITSVVLFGPVAAFLLVVFQFMSMEWKFTRDEFSLHFSFYKRSFPIMVALASVAVLGMLFLYMVAENCNCH
jgi:hypothetical protein